MLRVFASLRHTATPTATGGSTTSTIHLNSLLLPAIVLVFLVLVVAYSAVRANSNITPPSVAESNSDAAVNAAITVATPPVNTDPEPTSPPAADNNNVSINATSLGGESTVKVEVNGQEVPVQQQGITHQTITQNGSQTTIDVNAQNGQSTMSATTTNGAHNSSWYSYGFHSSTVTGNNN